MIKKSDVLFATEKIIRFVSACINSLQDMNLVVCLDDSCAGSRVPISDTTLFQECQITSSSDLDPLEYSVHRGLSAQLSKGKVKLHR